MLIDASCWKGYFFFWKTDRAFSLFHRRPATLLAEMCQQHFCVSQNLSWCHLFWNFNIFNLSSQNDNNNLDALNIFALHFEICVLLEGHSWPKSVLGLFCRKLRRRLSQITISQISLIKFSTSALSGENSVQIFCLFWTVSPLTDFKRPIFGKKRDDFL